MFNKFILILTSSVVSAVVGWLTAILVLFIGLLPSGGGSLFALVVGVVTLPVVLLAAVFLLWPLFVLVPRSWVLWHPAICTICGAFAGSALAEHIYDWTGERTIFTLVGSLGAIVGGMSTYVCCRLHTSQFGNTYPSLPHALFLPVGGFVSSSKRWLMVRFEGWSGQ